MQPAVQSADLGTLQAEVTSESGLRYLEEAQSLFGAGTVPAPMESPPAGAVDAGMILFVGGAALVATLVTAGVLIQRERSGG